MEYTFYYTNHGTVNNPQRQYQLHDAILILRRYIYHHKGIDIGSVIINTNEDIKLLEKALNFALNWHENVQK